jgi:exopolyphosphatase/pppGpp-phosphohydrolase
MNLDAARSYALDYLKNSTDPAYHYHNMSHTLDVFHSVSILAISEKISRKNQNLLQTAALFHDLGIYKKYDRHEEESIQIMQNALPGFDYRRSEIKTICKLISDTNILGSPKTEMGKLLRDADLDYLGREDYFKISEQLRKEWEELGIKKANDKEWYEFQIKFLEDHSYYSKTARITRNEGKINNLKKVSKLLVNL